MSYNIFDKNIGTNEIRILYMGFKMWTQKSIIISSSILLWNLILLIIFTIESTPFIITIETRRMCKNTINLKQIGSVLIF